MKSIKALLFCSLGMFLLIACGGESMGQGKVVINDQVVSSRQLSALKSAYGIDIQAGNYWYDKRCGAWGMLGGPTLGFVPPYLNVGGNLKQHASRGHTGVIVNGRELPLQDVNALKQIIDVKKGRFWLDAQGNGGYEGYGASFNLKYLAQRARGSSFYRNNYTGLGTGSSGGTFYMIGKDVSLILD